MAFQIEYRRVARCTLIAAWALGGYLIAGSSLGQEIDPNAVREEDLWKYREKKIAVLDYVPSASKRANALLEEYELVALGEFTAISEPDEDYLTPRLVIVTFRIEEIFKGPKEPSEVSVELMSDMLAFPGEDVSRHSKRMQQWKDLTTQEESIKRELAALDESLRAGAISQQEYNKARDEFEQMERKRVSTGIKLVGRQIAMIDGQSFYDLVTMERPAPDSQARGLRFGSGKPAAQSRIRMGAGHEEHTIRRFGCPCGDDCGGGSRDRRRGA